MTLPILSEDDYMFHKTLHHDIKLNQDKYKWDMQFENGDVVTVTGNESLQNAICIAIMTRFKELNHNKLYVGFGCRIHELIKANMSNMVTRKVEYYISDVLKSMRRVKKVNELVVSKVSYGYKVFFNVTSIDDVTVKGEVNI